MLDEGEMDEFGLAWGDSLPNGDAGYVVLCPPPDVIVESHGDHRLLVRYDGEWTVQWALLEWCTSNMDGSSPTYDAVAHGMGFSSPSGSVREPRHTWFGDENGYVYYVNPALLAWAFSVLGRWFDYDE